MHWCWVEASFTEASLSKDSVSARTALCLLSYSNGGGTQSVRARVQARGSTENLAHARPVLMYLLGPLNPPFYYFLSTRVIIRDFPLFVVKITQGTFNDVCCDHIHWTCWLFCCCFLSGLCLDSSPSAEWLHISWLICCHISIHTYILRHTDFCLSCCLHCFVRLIHSHTSCSQFKIVFLNTRLVYYICYITYHLTLGKSIWKLSNSGIWMFFSLTKYCT